ncbi:RluA family pseudouridine synthase [uncultured Bacteroides sp.]|uniref:RluA family pseudouridine synthase n=1 Tax=uncultured Bacteroides sp. TaxID=162156 RepID=UPI00260C1249|nr:RluA family pseudouridine synthase [uncultured Bacteroides sp.]
MFHHFKTSIADIPLPKKFTYPFCYTPHPLCVRAAEEVQHYLEEQKEWQEELEQGKMFGVLVVQTADGEVGYLAAFSGILAGKNHHPYFVPPVYDLLQPQGFFRIEEENISAINRHIKRLEETQEYASLLSELEQARRQAQDALDAAKLQLKEAKKKREARRKEPGFIAEEEASLIRESQFQKAEYKRLERSWKEKTDTLQAAVDTYEQQIQQLRTERKKRSAALQIQLFQQFKMLNYRKEVETLDEIFSRTVHKIPPAGAGECAAPKLLQQAYLHNWKPVAMAEFWWGASPKNEIRHHGYYYPACKGKCEPILQHMLQGLDVEENPLKQPTSENNGKLDVIYEDEYIAVINKPAGMLSVPGKDGKESVYSLARKLYPEADGPMIVHRLDMATSGLLIIAKNKKAHQHLQAQFKNHSIRKKYIALLDGIIRQDQGTIELPLRPDPLDRPRQVVDMKHGKTAITHYQVLERTERYTRVAFYPHTGRTHQLRVHAAHPQGLHCPIIGDELYGKKNTRLYLHAESIEFVHPANGQVIRITKEAGFPIRINKE